MDYYLCIETQNNGPLTTSRVLYLGKRMLHKVKTSWFEVDKRSVMSVLLFPKLFSALHQSLIIQVKVMHQYL